MAGGIVRVQDSVDRFLMKLPRRTSRTMACDTTSSGRTSELSADSDGHAQREARCSGQTEGMPFCYNRLTALQKSRLPNRNIARI